MASSGAKMERDVAPNGYESPDEHSQPPFFTSAQFTAPSQGTSNSPLKRPNLVARPSYIPPPKTSADELNGGAQTGSGLDSVLANAGSGAPHGRVSVRDRIACMQWTWFAMTMATGGIANVLHSLSYRGAWVDGIGLAFFFINLTFFIINCVLISIRFHLRPEAFMKAFTDQTESLFIPSFFVSITVILINICQYGVPHTAPWLLRVMEVMFWVNAGLCVLVSASIYLILWSTMIFPIHMMTPVWVFPAYPLLLSGPFAANLIASAVRSGRELTLNSTAVALCALATQGAGCLIAFMISSAFIYRLMTQKLPRDMQRPGVFISVGPYAFTVVAIVQLGQYADIILPQDFMGTDQAVPIVRIMSVMAALWLWGLSLWFFLVSVGSLYKYTKPDRSMPFQMTWWSFVFPNTALITATESMAGAFDNNGLRILSAVMTGCLIIVWAVVLYAMLVSLKHRKLLWPKDDK